MRNFCKFRMEELCLHHISNVRISEDSKGEESEPCIHGSEESMDWE